MTHQFIGKTRIARFTRDEDGAMTVLGVFLTIAILLCAGLAIDVNNAIQSEVQLQGTADAAAHAGMVELYKNGNSDDVQDKAVEIAQMNMPTSLYGNVVISTDVQVGSWNASTRTFTAGSSTQAVRAVARRVDSRSNGLSTFLLRLVGLDTLQLSAQAVYAAEGGFCPEDEDGNPSEGFIALGEVDMQSSNVFNDGFCIHGEEGVKVSQHNDVTDAYVTMAKFNLLQGPGSQDAESAETLEEQIANYADVYDDNPGLGTAHGTYSYAAALAAYFSAAEDALDELWGNPEGEYTNSPLIPKDDNDDNAVDLSNGVVNWTVSNNNNSDLENGVLGKTILQTDLAKNTVHKIVCDGQGNETITLDNNAEFSEMVIITDCKIQFGNGSSFANGSLITTNTSKNNNTITGANGTRIGSTGYCGADGASDGIETVVMTAGDMSFASELLTYGVNAVVLGSVHNVAAQGNSSGGINLYSQGDINLTTSGTYGFCGQAPNGLFDIGTFRLVL